MHAVLMGKSGRIDVEDVAQLQAKNTLLLKSGQDPLRHVVLGLFQLQSEAMSRAAEVRRLQRDGWGRAVAS